jgi:hypothetical protein
VTQTLPAADDFAYGSPVYGANVIGWLGARVNTSTFQPGRLHDGYGGAAVRGDNQADGTGNPSGFIRRQIFPAPQRVVMTAHKQVVIGLPDNAQLKQHAVLARLTAGTLAGDGTSSVRLESCTCYAFTMEWLAAGPAVRYRLKRFDAGTETVLATYDDPTAVPAIFTAEIRLTLDVTTNGSGNVELKGYVANASLGLGPGGPGLPGGGTLVFAAGGAGGVQVAGPGPLPGTQVTAPQLPTGTAPGAYGQPDDLLVVSATDSSGSKITASGRAGFAMDVERQVGSPLAAVVSVASSTEVWDLTSPATPALVIRDEFLRAAPALGGAMVDRWGTPGHNVASDYTCDQASVAAAGAILKRSTASEAAESPTTVPMGKAVTLDGTADYLELQNTHKTYPPPPLPSASAVTLASWAKLTSSSAATRTLYAGHTDPLTFSGSGFRFQLVVAGASSKLQVYTHSATGNNTYDSPLFSITPYVNNAWCYAFSFKANSNPVTGAGRIRFYIGRLGVATLLGEVSVPANVQPQWKSFGTHTYGASQTPDNWWAGTVDELNIFFQELTPAQVAQVCDANTDPALYPSMGLAAGWHLDTFTDLGGADGKRWQPYYAAVPGGPSADTADWLREKNTVTVADPGLVPVSPAASFYAIAQRPATDPAAQHRTLDFRPASDTSVGGLLVRAAPTATPGVLTAYRLDVAAGVPARVVLYRLVAGVPTPMAQQDPLTGTINVASGSFSTIALAVQQQVGGGPAGPVLLTPKIGGVLVPMVSLLPGEVLVDLTGNIIDIGDARILSGPAQGFYGFIDGLANRFDAWAEGATTAVADPSTFGSYAVPAEDDGASGNLATVLTPAWDIELQMPAPISRLVFDSGHAETRVLDSYVRRTFQLHLVGGSDAEIAALRAFWNAHSGSVLGFDFDPSVYMPDQQAGTFHFREESLHDSYQGRRRVTSFVLDEFRAS